RTIYSDKPFFFFQAEDGIRYRNVTGVQTCALPISLGKEVAECFLAQGHDVTLVTTQRAVKPKKHSKLKIILVETVADLIAELEPLVKTHDAIIHSMAVSDYTPVYMTDLEEVEKAPAIKDLLHKSNTSAKISSQQDYQVLFLKKTPKVISLIKQWN